MKQKFLYIGAFIIVVTGAVLWFANRSVTPSATPDTSPPLTAAPEQPVQVTGKIEVVEFFWYGCPHCYSLEPYLEDWLKTKPDDVVFRRLPGILGEGWIPHGRAFFAAQKLGILDQIHRPLFDAIHKDGEHIVNEKRLREFFTSQAGINADAFDKAYQSDEVTEKVKQAFSLGQSYQLTGVPTIIINGKHMTSVSKAGGNRELIEVINQLIEQERQTRQAAK